MNWEGQSPPIEDRKVILSLIAKAGGSHLIVIDEPETGRYRCTIGTLFDFRELGSTTALRDLVYLVNRMGETEQVSVARSGIKAIEQLCEKSPWLPLDKRRKEELPFGLLPCPPYYTVVTCTLEDGDFVDYVEADTPLNAARAAERARFGEHVPPLKSIVFAGHCDHLIGP